MSYKGLFYPESRFGGFSDIDGTIAFYMRVNALLKPSDTVLDVGCGRGAYQDDPIAIRRNLRILKGKVKKVIGIDVDAAAQSNPFLDEFRFIGDDEWPIEADSVDLILSDYVLEHIVDVDRFFFEARRVLKNGGYLCIRTSNRWSYIGLFSRLIPNQYHWRSQNLSRTTGRKKMFFRRCTGATASGKSGQRCDNMGSMGWCMVMRQNPPTSPFQKLLTGLACCTSDLRPLF